MNKTLLLIFSLLPLISFSQEVNMPELEGWTKTDETLVFNKDNLFEHINGASEFYLSYNFQKLYVESYEKGEAELTIEVYDQGDEVNAYGIYSMERSKNAKIEKIGLQGYYDASTLNFTTGKYYIKMMSYEIENAGAGFLSEVANKLALTLCATPEIPSVINAFPQENLILNSRQYISNNFMGLSFLGAAYRATYNSTEGDYTIFVIKRESAEEIEAIVKKYHEFSETKLKKLKEGTYLIEDPFNGTINLKWTGKYLLGASGNISKKQFSKISEQVEKSLNVK